MAIVFGKPKATNQSAKPIVKTAKPAKPAPAAAPDDNDPPFDTGEAQVPTITSDSITAPQTPKKSGGLSFLKRGAEAQAIAKIEEKKAEMRKTEIFRFYLPEGKESSITFLDGDLVDGLIDATYYHEHQVFKDGSWKNWFICTQDEGWCPICDGGDEASYVGIFTVIDHSEYKDKSGKVWKDTLKLFVAKRDTIKMLQKQAVKRGGLRGCRFDVSRVGDKSANVGNAFEFVSKKSDQQLAAAYGANSKAVDYEKYMAGMYIEPAQLKQMGFGSHGVGTEPGVKDHEYNV